ncbi:succinate--CoA ligase subunit alpha [Alloscardovia macacae]|uniref:Succinate--CoA ligase [ADP-forming] subunit alpha n=1 Tax=Alloscardovia macacae TaxID=1160091 RepID=A0A1Y2T3S1_9BIFI|nr:succinate--CoA ligase subunit alpha [Alloscardovia macacae]OTA27525.1 succinate--CoA ligase subunit alpha [Alloscardovia macacae]OTA30173.1 succinate--CoA ligase subunit alpha [Alloscardovia macacae]
MSFIRPNAPVIVQGMTGHQGMTHTARMLKAGTNIVAGVNPRKGGQSLSFEDREGQRDVAIYATCEEARTATGAEASVIFVPPRFAKAAMVEAIEAEIPLIVVITEGIPVADTAYCVALAQKHGVRIVGPNCPGLATYTSEEDMASGSFGVNLGIIPDTIVKHGPLGLVSKSGTLTYQMMSELADYGFGAAIGVGGDPIVGTTQQEALEILNEDPDIKACVLIGEIGGSAEQELALWAKDHMTKPLVAYIAGYSAPEGKQMGHAGAIVSGGSGTAQGKKEALEACGIKVGRNPSETAQFMREIMENL